MFINIALITDHTKIILIFFSNGFIHRQTDKLRALLLFSFHPSLHAYHNNKYRRVITPTWSSFINITLIHKNTISLILIIACFTAELCYAILSSSIPPGYPEHHATTPNIELSWVVYALS